MKNIILKLLHSLTRAVLKKYHPTIIAITGSVGKTATKEAVFVVLASKYRVRKNAKNYNTETGLPLTVLGCRPPAKSLLKWCRVFWRGLGLLLFKHDYPEMLVLEMGAGRPGDIAELLGVVTPQVGVITAIAATHTEKFGSVAGVAKEKGKLYRVIDKDGYIVVNFDDKEVVKLAEAGKGKIISYGITASEEVMVRGAEIAVSRSNENLTGISGMSFKLITEGTVTPVLLRDVLGEHQVYLALAAAAVGQIFDIHSVDIAEALGKVEPSNGRMRLLPGIKHTLIIDDTYNASPIAMEAALQAVAQLDGEAKKYAVLGDMLELGSLTESEHQKIGKLVAKLKFDVLIAVGEKGRDIARAAKKAGMSEDYVFEFEHAQEAGRFVQDRIEQGDVILVKGSRGMAMETIVKEIMAEPERADELLVPSR
ncbi:MAG: Mur ligase family protein [Patescibacteria group bacterium]